jgi:CDP-6-deoxy-D-xylo-4-hexulose-3-dehydrase
MSVTSFANSHILSCGGNGGMLLLDDEKRRDRALMLRRWGRRSEIQFFGSKRGERDFWEDLDGIRYDNQFIFDELGWNFEPSEIGAAFGLEQLKKLDGNLARRRKTFEGYTQFFEAHAERFQLPRQLEGLETAWLGYPLLIRPDAGFERPELQQYLDDRGIDTRTIWTGNVARQPMLRGRRVVLPEDGLPNADAVMARGVLLPLSHAIDDDALDFVLATLAAFLRGR